MACSMSRAPRVPARRDACVAERRDHLASNTRSAVCRSRGVRGLDGDDHGARAASNMSRLLSPAREFWPSKMPSHVFDNMLFDTNYDECVMISAGRRTDLILALLHDEP